MQTTVIFRCFARPGYDHACGRQAANRAMHRLFCRSEITACETSVIFRGFAIAAPFPDGRGTTFVVRARKNLRFPP